MCSVSAGRSVELGVPGERRMAVRDSKNPGGSKLSFSKRGWATFAGRLKRR
ncbi:DUF397 domain-containing protein [Actinocorallia herbida]|uniref:DUF397 domain-containing protein n=1 Tax=Actinocorallia herbida TaxID=58109 RepID=UPI000F4B54FD|nr:DUF397 domain-containing protein [Actinocorallia herbida]